MLLSKVVSDLNFNFRKGHSKESLAILSCLAETKLGNCLCYTKCIVLIQYLKETENKGSFSTYLNVGTIIALIKDCVYQSM